MDNDKKQQITVQSISTTGLLGVAFVVLKLLDVIQWSWWWVLAPFWMPWAIIIVVLLIAAIYFIAKG